MPLRPLIAFSAVLALGLVPLAPNAEAQVYPTQPVRILVSFPAGGSVDLMTRTIAARLSEALGKPVVVENRPGAGGRVAVQAMLAAGPDGHTLLATSSSTITVASHLEKLDYDPIADLVPLAIPGRGTIALAVRADSSLRSLSDLIDASKRAPAGLSYAMPGVATISHLAAELLKTRSGANLVAIPYQGSGPAAQAVVSGEVPVAMSDVTTLRGQIDGGVVRLLAVLTEGRSPLAPNVPTVAESGFPGYSVSAWIGMFAPRGIDAAIAERLNAEILKVTSQPDLRTVLLREGFEPMQLSLPAARQLIETESRTWAQVIAAAGIRLN